MGLSDIVYQRMRNAISRLHTGPSDHELSKEDSWEVILQGTHLRDILLRSFDSALPTQVTTDNSSNSPSTHQQKIAHPPHLLQAAGDASYPLSSLSHLSREAGDHGGAFSQDQRIRSWYLRHMQTKPVWIEGDPPLEGLNDSQRRAVATMVGERVSLIQGVSSLDTIFTTI
jgi:hypothetical protein